MDNFVDMCYNNKTKTRKEGSYEETIGSVFLDIPAAANIDIITMSASNTPAFPDLVHEMADIRIIRARGGRQQRRAFDTVIQLENP